MMLTGCLALVLANAASPVPSAATPDFQAAWQETDRRVAFGLGLGGYTNWPGFNLELQVPTVRWLAVYGRFIGPDFIGVHFDSAVPLLGGVAGVRFFRGVGTSHRSQLYLDLDGGVVEWNRAQGQSGSADGHASWTADLGIGYEYPLGFAFEPPLDAFFVEMDFAGQGVPSYFQAAPGVQGPGAFQFNVGLWLGLRAAL